MDGGLESKRKLTDHLQSLGGKGRIARLEDEYPEGLDADNGHFSWRQTGPESAIESFQVVMLDSLPEPVKVHRVACLLTCRPVLLVESLPIDSL